MAQELQRANALLDGGWFKSPATVRHRESRSAAPAALVHEAKTVVGSSGHASDFRATGRGFLLPRGFLEGH